MFIYEELNRAILLATNKKDHQLVSQSFAVVNSS